MLQHQLVSLTARPVVFQEVVVEVVVVVVVVLLPLRVSSKAAGWRRRFAVPSWYGGACTCH